MWAPFHFSTAFASDGFLLLMVWLVTCFLSCSPLIFKCPFSHGLENASTDISKMPTTGFAFLLFSSLACKFNEALNILLLFSMIAAKIQMQKNNFSVLLGAKNLASIIAIERHVSLVCLHVFFVLFFFFFSLDATLTKQVVTDLAFERPLLSVAQNMCNQMSLH